MISYEKAGQNIKELRVKNNLTQSELASKIGVSVASIRRWEKGKFQRTKISYIVSIADYFNVPLYNILGC